MNMNNLSLDSITKQLPTNASTYLAQSGNFLYKEATRNAQHVAKLTKDVVNMNIAEARDVDGESLEVNEISPTEGAERNDLCRKLAQENRELKNLVHEIERAKERDKEEMEAASSNWSKHLSELCESKEAEVDKKNRLISELQLAYDESQEQNEELEGLIRAKDKSIAMLRSQFDACQMSASPKNAPPENSDVNERNLMQVMAERTALREENEALHAQLETLRGGELVGKASLGSHSDLEGGHDLLVHRPLPRSLQKLRNFPGMSLLVENLWQRVDRLDQTLLMPELKRGPIRAFVLAHTLVIYLVLLHYIFRT